MRQAIGCLANRLDSKSELGLPVYRFTKAKLDFSLSQSGCDIAWVVASFRGLYRPLAIEPR
jgi:hypothetical protein